MRVCVTEGPGFFGVLTTFTGIAYVTSSTFDEPRFSDSTIWEDEDAVLLLGWLKQDPGWP